MNILITGNMGYVGPVLAREIKRHDRGARVTGLDNAYFAGCLLDRHDMAERHVDCQIYKDARDVTEGDFCGIDSVICLAALSNDPMGNRYSSQTTEINYKAVEKASTLAKTSGVKNFVFASSCSVYGFSESGECDESSQVNPLTEYARSKVASEDTLAGIADESFRVTCLRFATACGASPRIRLDLVLNDFVASALTTGKIEILSDGTPWRPLIDVHAMAQAMIWASERKSAPSYLLLNAGSNGWNFQIKDLARKVSGIIPGTEVFISPDGQPDKRSYRVRFDKFAQATKGAVAIGDIDDTIKGIRDILVKNAFEDANFRKSEYVRLNMLQYWASAKAIDESLRWAKQG
jgi:nucleoside-diphosphate-sugar epimerase